MKHILVNYNFTPDWLKDKDYLIYDRSDSKEWLKDFDQSRIIYTENIGNVDYDKLTYLIDNYDNLPDVFLWGKTNLFKYISEEEYELVKDNKTFTPLLTQHHGTKGDERGMVCFYLDGMYYERNQLIYAIDLAGKHFNFYSDFAKEFGLPNPQFLPFPPGGNFTLTKEVVHKHPKELYVRMANTLPYTQIPVEAYFCERSYLNLWKQ